MPSRFGSPGKREEQSDHHVLDVCMCDFTGPVVVNLWGHLALQFLDQISKIEPPVILRLTGITATKLANNAWKGPSLTSIHVLNSVQGFPERPNTELSFVTTPESPYMIETLFEAPSMPVCMNSFRPLLPKAGAPFRASFRGVVAEVGQLAMTANGQPKRSFAFVDGSGNLLPCCAFGQHAQNV